MGIYQSVTELVGKTPLLQLNNYDREHETGADIVAKVEFFNPNQSVKDRIALEMIEEAERTGKLKKGDTIVETTSGNTGIGIAAIAAAKGYKFRVYVQDDVSIERFKVMKAFGAEVLKMTEEPVVAKTLAETKGDFMAAVTALREYVINKDKHLVFLDQCSNLANPNAHRKTTGPEIWKDTEGKVDIFVATAGTGGTISGTGSYLKEKNPDIKIVGVQPGPNSLPSDENPTPENQITGVHPFDGVPLNLVPKTMDLKIYDEVIRVEAIDAYKTVRDLAKTEGILVGESSGAALNAATQLAKRPENKGKRIVVILPDTGLRYLSTNLFE